MNSKWFTIFAPIQNVKCYLFCFHYAGGNSNVFRTWQDHMPPGVQVVGVELPGHGKRLAEQRIDDLQTLVQYIGVELYKQVDAPFAFFGHSMGALLGLELARFAKRHRLAQPRHLFVSAHKAPQLPRDTDPLHVLPEADFIQRLRDLNGTPVEVLDNEELRALFLPIIRTDFKVCETYAYQTFPKLECPMTIFGGKDDDEVDYAGLQAWEQLTTGPTQVHMCEGNHFFIHNAKETLLPILTGELQTMVEKNEHERIVY